MARLPRIVVPDQLLHVMQRSNNRQAVFFSGVGNQMLFHTQVEIGSLHSLREVIELAGIAGSERLKEQIAAAMRHVGRLLHGGDRKSRAFRRQFDVALNS